MDTMVESTVGGARVELSLKLFNATLGLTEGGSLRCVEYPVSQKDRQTRATSTARKPKVELLAHRT